MMEQRVEDYANPIFLFGKVLNALLLDPVDADLARMRLMNEILEDGEKAYGAEFLDRINAVANRERGNPFKKIEDLVIRPSARTSASSPARCSRTCARTDDLAAAPRCGPRPTSSGRRRTPESDLLSYLLFDGDFLGPADGARLRATPAPGKKSWRSSSPTPEPPSRPLHCGVRGDQLARQWQLIQRLAKSRAGVALDDLAAELGCVRRTVYRDLDALMFAGFPVVSEKRDGRVYYRFLESFRLGDVPFTPDEILALAFSEDLLRTLEGTVFHDSIRSALRKIRSGLGPELGDYLARLGGCVPRASGTAQELRAFPRRDPDPERRRGPRTTVRMRYRTGRTGSVATRRSGPVPGLVPQRWALRRGSRPQVRRGPHLRDRSHPPPRNHRRRDSKCPRPSTSTPTSARPSASSPSRRRGSASASIGVGPPTWRSAPGTRARPSSTAPAARSTSRMDVGGTPDLRTWVLSFGSGAEVLEPESLRAEVVGELEECARPLRIRALTVDRAARGRASRRRRR